MANTCFCPPCGSVSHFSPPCLPSGFAWQRRFLRSLSAPSPSLLSALSSGAGGLLGSTQWVTYLARRRSHRAHFSGRRGLDPVIFKTKLARVADGRAGRLHRAVPGLHSGRALPSWLGQCAPVGSAAWRSPQPLSLLSTPLCSNSASMSPTTESQSSLPVSSMTWVP